MSDHLRSQFASDTISRHFDDAALLAAMARFEGALAQAQADAGLVPRAAADQIAALCLRIDGIAALPAAFSPEVLGPAARHTGNLAVPFVDALVAAVSRDDPQAARWVHFGASAQDLLDTAVTLQARSAGNELLAQVTRVGDLLVRLADSHRTTAVSARSQPSSPLPFGWMAACWLSPLPRLQRALSQSIEEAAVLQFGGDCGMRSALHGQGDAMADSLASRLELNNPGISWHGSRDRIARLGAELALATGAMARIGRDLSRLMPNAANVELTGHPVAVMYALQAALRAPGLTSTLLAQQAVDLDGRLGAWQADWFTLGALFECAGSASEAIGETLEALCIGSSGSTQPSPVAQSDASAMIDRTLEEWHRV